MKEAVGERLQTKIATTESRSTLADFLSQAVQAGHHQSLTERQRNVLGLRYGAGLTLEGVARQLQVTRQKVKQHEDRAWQKLIPNFSDQDQIRIETLLNKRVSEAQRRRRQREKMAETIS